MTTKLHTVEGKAHTAQFIIDNGHAHYGGLVIRPPVSFSERVLDNVDADTGAVLEEMVSTQSGTYFGLCFSENEFRDDESRKLYDRVLEAATSAAVMLVEYADFTHENGIDLMMKYHGHK